MARADMIKALESYWLSQHDDDDGFDGPMYLDDHLDYYQIMSDSELLLEYNRYIG